MTEISKSNLWNVNDLAMMAESQDKELKRRLTLYQVFLKIYEHHSTLLDEILELENLDQPSLTLVKGRYFQGVIDGSAVYVNTNLCNNQTQALRQPQQIWTIGRDRNNGIYIADQYLSRRHAAIQYIPKQGFYLIDFKSTNGSFVNGKRTYQSQKLKDGDRIRLGNMTFDFFLSYSSRMLPSVAMELLMQLAPKAGGIDETLSGAGKLEKPRSETVDNNIEFSRELSLIKKLDDNHSSLNAQHQSEILDRFFSKSIPSNNNS